MKKQAANAGKLAARFGGKGPWPRRVQKRLANLCGAMWRENNARAGRESRPAGKYTVQSAKSAIMRKVIGATK